MVDNGASRLLIKEVYIIKAWRKNNRQTWKYHKCHKTSYWAAITSCRMSVSIKKGRAGTTDSMIGIYWGSGSWSLKKLKRVWFACRETNEQTSITSLTSPLRWLQIATTATEVEGIGDPDRDIPINSSLIIRFIPQYNNSSLLQTSWAAITSPMRLFSTCSECPFSTCDIKRSQVFPFPQSHRKCLSITLLPTVPPSTIQMLRSV